MGDSTASASSKRLRRLAAALEPVVGQVYFSPECHEAYAALVMLGHTNIVTEVGHHAPGFYSAMFLDTSLEEIGIRTVEDLRKRFRERHGLLGHLSGAIPGIPGLPGSTPPASGGATGSAQALDPNLAALATGPMALFANSEAPGMAKEGPVVAGNFQAGQTLESGFTFQPGKCYTLVAQGAGPQIELEMQYVTPLPGLAPSIGKSKAGAQTSIGALLRSETTSIAMCRTCPACRPGEDLAGPPW